MRAAVVLVMLGTSTAWAHEVSKAKDQAAKLRAAAEKAKKAEVAPRDKYREAYNTKLVPAKQHMDDVCARERGQKLCSDAVLAYVAANHYVAGIKWEIDRADAVVVQKQNDYAKARSVLQSVSISCTSPTIPDGRECFDGDVFRPARDIDIVLDRAEAQRNQRFDAGRGHAADDKNPSTGGSSGGGSSGGGSSGPDCGSYDHPCGRPADPL